MSYPRIAIVGAGPSGLTLARILVKHSIIPQIYERDPHPNYRPQGGTLDLHEHSGQLAIRETGLWEEFLKHARYDSQETKFFDKSGTLIMQEHGSTEGAKGTKPEIDRTALRNMLLQSISPGLVYWDHTLDHVHQNPDKTFDLHFKDGKVEHGYDVIVGADGAWSRVRPLLTSVKPFYSGSCFIEIAIPDPTGAEHSDVNTLVGRGSVFAIGDGKTILAQRLGDGTIRVYAAISTGEHPSWAEQFVTGPSDQVRANILAQFEGWAPQFLDILRLTEGPIIPRPLYMFPVDHSWDGRPGVTLIGDAGHLMTPYAGEGVNMALWDALELATAIITGVKDGTLDEKIRESELELFKRAEDSARRTERNMRLTLNKDFEKSSMDEIVREWEERTGKSLRG